MDNREKPHGTVETDISTAITRATTTQTYCNDYVNGHGFIEDQPADQIATFTRLGCTLRRSFDREQRSRNNRTTTCGARNRPLPCVFAFHRTIQPLTMKNNRSTSLCGPVLFSFDVEIHCNSLNKIWLQQRLSHFSSI